VSDGGLSPPPHFCCKENLCRRILVLLLGVLVVFSGCGSSGWEVVGQPGVSDGAAHYNTICCMPIGKLYAAYRDEYSAEDSDPNQACMNCGRGKITVLEWLEHGWQPLGPARFTGSAAYISLASLNGNLYLAYYDYEVAGRASVMIYNGQDWDYVGPKGISQGPAHNTADSC